MTEHDIATLLAKNFIARRDVKAIQHGDGSWAPHTDSGKRDGNRLKWTMTDLKDHIAGTRTFGHYMLDTDSKCKLFAFDIDFQQNKLDDPNKFVGTWLDADDAIQTFDAREAWLDRRHPSRELMKSNMMMLARSIESIIRDDLELPTAVAYSGGKGVHVYGLTGLIDAADAREGANMVFEILDEFEPTRGDNFWRAKDQGLTNMLRNFTIEVFPKQDSLAGKDLGNLMRMPLGVNLKNPRDKTFFIDPASGLKMTAIDPITALTFQQEATA